MRRILKLANFKKSRRAFVASILIHASEGCREMKLVFARFEAIVHPKKRTKDRSIF